MTFDDVEAAMGDIPALGEHTDEVLAGLGLSAAEIEALATARVVGRGPAAQRSVGPRPLACRPCRTCVAS